MKKYIVDETDLIDIGNAIRENKGTTDKIEIPNMGDEIRSISVDPTKGYVQDGLVGFFELNGSCYDYMGNFPIVENTMTFREDGKTHKMARHDGHCTFNASKIANSKQFTISLWIKSNKFNGSYFFSIGKQAFNYHAIGLLIKNVATGKLKFNFSGETFQDINSIDALDNKWHQVTITYNNNLLNCYIDNVNCKLNKTIDITIGEPNYAKGVIGAYLSGGERTSAGTKIANFIIYNRSLTQAEIEQNYNADKNMFVNGNPPLRDKPTTKCEYIYSSARTNGIYLDVPTRDNIEVIIDFQMDDVDLSGLFGTYNTPRFYMIWYKSKWYYDINTSLNTAQTSNIIKPNIRQTIDFNTKDHKVFRKIGADEPIELFHTTAQMTNGYYNIVTFGRTRGTNISDFAKNKIFDIVVKDNVTNTVLKHFIPCLDEKGIPCLYEEKEHIYYYDDNTKSYSRFDYKELIK